MLRTEKQIKISKEKLRQVELITKKIQESSAIIFYNFSHAENEEIFSLKKELKKVKSEWLVFKNTLFKKALKNDFLNLKNNNAFIFCKDENNQYKTLKILKNFDFKNCLKNRIRGGIYQNNLIDQSTLVEWADLKPKENILNDICNLLFFNTIKFTMLLDQINTNKE